MEDAYFSKMAGFQADYPVGQALVIALTFHKFPPLRPKVSRYRPMTMARNTPPVPDRTRASESANFSGSDISPGGPQ
jgi:hypothetical protein